MSLILVVLALRALTALRDLSLRACCPSCNGHGYHHRYTARSAHDPRGTVGCSACGGAGDIGPHDDAHAKATRLVELFPVTERRAARSVAARILASRTIIARTSLALRRGELAPCARCGGLFPAGTVGNDDGACTSCLDEATEVAEERHESFLSWLSADEACELRAVA